ncbi:MAG: GGDEF domain-containing protein, partial [Oscillospiraceae bacterium]
KKTKRTLALREKAEYDGITGLYNRATYEEMVENVLADHNRGLCAFVEFDLDNFKQVNDTYGHLTGDKLLHQVATAVAKSCRKEDLLGRLGGDEFAIWFSDVGNVENVVKKIQEISCQIQEISTGMALQVHVTASFGIVMVGPGDRSFRGLFRKSDEAMYEVKHSGKNSYQIYRPKK